MDGNRGGGLVVGAGGEDGIGLAREVAEGCIGFLRPLLRRLDEYLDLRLVRTVANVVMAIVDNRNRPAVLLLSELGEHLAGGPEHGPAGTKRIDRLVHSGKWRAQEVEGYLLEEAGRVAGQEAGRVGEDRAFLILDGSVIEKPESMGLEGLAPVRSAKARRIGRPRPKLGKGYYRGKPGPPVVVPGFEWVSAVVTGWASRAERRQVAPGAWHWYAKRREVSTGEGPEVVRQKGMEAAGWVLGRVTTAWGRERLLHVWDRGLSRASWLSGPG